MGSILKEEEWPQEGDMQTLQEKLLSLLQDEHDVPP